MTPDYVLAHIEAVDTAGKPATKAVTFEGLSQLLPGLEKASV